MSSFPYLLAIGFNERHEKKYDTLNRNEALIKISLCNVHARHLQRQRMTLSEIENLSCHEKRRR